MSVMSVNISSNLWSYIVYHDSH